MLNFFLRLYSNWKVLRIERVEKMKYKQKKICTSFAQTAKNRSKYLNSKTKLDTFLWNWP